MEKNNTSSSSICSKIRQGLASYPAFRAIHRINQYNRSEPKPVTITTHSSFPSPPPNKHTAKNTAIRANPPLPQHVKVNTEGEGAIPINFDYSTPSSSMGNGNSSSSISKVHGQSSKVAEPQYNVPRQGKPPTKVEFVGFPTNKGTAPGPLKEQDGLGVQHPEQQQGTKTVLDINDIFTEYIQRANYRIRNVVRDQGNSAADEANGTKPERAFF